MVAAVPLEGLAVPGPQSTVADHCASSIAPATWPLVPPGSAPEAITKNAIMALQ